MPYIKVPETIFLIPEKVYILSEETNHAQDVLRSFQDSKRNIHRSLGEALSRPPPSLKWASHIWRHTT
jgi:hypothetical protein